MGDYSEDPSSQSGPAASGLRDSEQANSPPPSCLALQPTAQEPGLCSTAPGLTSAYLT